MRGRVREGGHRERGHSARLRLPAQRAVGRRGGRAGVHGQPVPGRLQGHDLLRRLRARASSGAWSSTPGDACHERPGLRHRLVRASTSSRRRDGDTRVHGFGTGAPGTGSIKRKIVSAPRATARPTAAPPPRLLGRGAAAGRVLERRVRDPDGDAADLRLGLRRRQRYLGAANPNHTYSVGRRLHRAADGGRRPGRDRLQDRARSASATPHRPRRSTRRPTARSTGTATRCRSRLGHRPAGRARCPRPRCAGA